MTTLLVNMILVLIFVLVLPRLLGEWVARKNAAMVDDSALVYTGAHSRTELVNQRAHVNQDPRFAQNPANTGFIFFYDCRDGDLMITGKIPECEYFSISVYDRYSMPLPSMFIGYDVKKGNRRFTVFLTVRPTGAQNEIDVSICTQGTGIIRYSYMQHPEKVADFEPKLTSTTLEDQ